MESRNTKEFLKNLKKTERYDSKLGVKYLKYTNKIKKASEYEDYVKDNVTIPLLDWMLQVLLIRPIVLFLALLLVFSALRLLLNHPPTIFLLAEGISISWYLFIEFIRELKSKEQVN